MIKTVMKELYEKLLVFANQWAHLGIETLPNGTKLIGRAPHIAPRAYLFRFFKGLSEKEIDKLEKELKTLLPDDFREFLSCSNGIHLFNTTLAINGLRTSNVRQGWEAIQPISLTLSNIDERPKDAGKNVLFIGYYDYDGSKIFMDLDNEKVHQAERYSAKIHHTWNNLQTFFEEETKRLGKLFDKDGLEIDSDMPTTP